MAFMPIAGTGLQGMAAPTPFSFPASQPVIPPTIPTIQQPLASQDVLQTQGWPQGVTPIGYATGGSDMYGIGSDLNAYTSSGQLFGIGAGFDPVTGKATYYTDPTSGQVIAYIDPNTGLITDMEGKTGQMNWLESQNTTLDIPTNVFPTASSSSSSQSGIYNQFIDPLSDIVNTLAPAATGYMDILNQVGSPGAFMASYNPVLEGSVDSIINDLAKRGLLDSGEKSNLLQEAMNAVPQAYMDYLLNVAGTYGEAVGLPIMAATGAEYSTSQGASLEEDPLAPYSLMVDMLLGT